MIMKVKLKRHGVVCSGIIMLLGAVVGNRAPIFVFNLGVLK